jgi:5-methylcytosine-specific restriction endonuclease McrA
MRKENKYKEKIMMFRGKDISCEAIGNIVGMTRQGVLKMSPLKGSILKKRVEFVLIRDNYVCQWCGRQDINSVIHLNGKQADFSLSNLMTICGGCMPKIFKMIKKNKKVEKNKK